VKQPKLAPKPKAAAPKQKPKPQPKPAPAKPKKKKMKTKPGINPITQQPYAKKSGFKADYVESGAVSLDNVRRRGRNRESPAQKLARLKALGLF
jgi:outer membrane biosynthesis protein TonB